MFSFLNNLFVRKSKTFKKSQSRSSQKPSRRGKSTVVLGLEEFESRLLPSSSPLSVVRDHLQDGAGNIVVLKGVNIASLEWRTDGDNILGAAKIAVENWHANVLRLPVNEDFWFGHNEASVNPAANDDGQAYRQLVDQVIQYASDHNAYVVLDLHWSDMGGYGGLNANGVDDGQGIANGQHYLPDDNSTLFWQDAAVRYSDHDPVNGARNAAVLFDPYNEPHFANDLPSDADFKTWRDGGTIHETWVDPNDNSHVVTRDYHSPGLQGLIDTIRTSRIDPITGQDMTATNIIAPEGLNWGADLTGVIGNADRNIMARPLSDPTGNLLYQVHLYPNKLDPNQGANPEVAASVEAIGKTMPIYVGEWGDGGFLQVNGDRTKSELPSDQAKANNQMLVNYLDQHRKFSWTAWALTADLGGGYNLLTDWNADKPTSDFGVYVKNALSPPVTIPDLTGAVFKLWGENGTDPAAYLTIQAEDVATGTFEGTYVGAGAWGAVFVSGSITNPTRYSGIEVTYSDITFAGVNILPFGPPRALFFQGQLEQLDYQDGRYHEGLVSDIAHPLIGWDQTWYLGGQDF
jgi:hypothetical protein